MAQGGELTGPEMLAQSLSAEAVSNHAVRI